MPVKVGAVSIKSARFFNNIKYAHLRMPFFTTYNVNVFLTVLTYFFNINKFTIILKLAVTIVIVFAQFSDHIVCYILITSSRS